MIHTAVDVDPIGKVYKPLNNFTIKDNETMKNNEELDFLQEVLGGFHGKLHDDRLPQYSDEVLKDLNEALLSNSPVSMLPNFNISPSGDEQGRFLIIDLGGSTLRIAIIEIRPRNNIQETANDRSNRISIAIEKKWIVNNNSKVIDNEFFKFMGSKIVETINEQEEHLRLINTNDEVINVGITWSFPLEQISHNSGRIVNVGKGWEISPEIQNQDLKFILQNSVKQHYNMNLDVKTIINDSLAVYAAGSFLSSDLKLAMVLGTGYNVCCSLNTDQFHPEKSLNEPAVLINSETSLFGSNLLGLSNDLDGIIDNRFLKPSFKSHMSADDNSKTIFQPYECMTSGRYLPELTRLSILKLVNNQEIFRHINLPVDSKLYIAYDGFSGELMCHILETDDIQQIADKINQEFDIKVDLQDALKIKQLVDSIIKRASYIITISIISFIKLLVSHNNETFPNKKLVIGYVGSILVYFNNYRSLILKYINENEYIKRLGITVDLMSIDNSSIVGAAIGAAYYIDK